MGYEAALAQYEKFAFDDGRWTRNVYMRGSGPAVIVIHEMPGLHPHVIRFADRVAAAGMTVYCPHLFGDPGRPASHPLSALTMLGGICIRREFNVWASDKSSPIVEWLKALSRKAHADCGGDGVGAVGMCFTGGFALAMMTEPSVVAPVLSQPSLPLGARRAAGIGASPAEVSCARKRFAEEGLSMIGLRFYGDPFVPDARFDTYKREFGDKFEAIEIDPKHAVPGGLKHPHSVLTINLAEDGPTKDAEARVLAFFRERTGAG
ncbi:dienelactone hydrolase [Phenylobacterium sp. Root77]|uniref:dienelactone hydrolase family protein n=1 Tax=unclassified Phenylobacterium TaxID=2640670 RepID=UPI0006F90E1B|nr:MULTISPECIES: dienelactone hydrolase family protein [unclassified Phenylobacterium]KQW69083.1 dienelactone hydrolase [Phenylobacterium sp. Root1277]KQW95550.1 dienelactone hydrolase [Phenylobacterium sp. Root1290]KRC41339.1 dienelactone hydrolase [Phenylobacterium sp. Root77]